MLSVKTHQEIVKMVKKISEESVDSGKCFSLSYFASDGCEVTSVYPRYTQVSMSCCPGRLFMLLRSCSSDIDAYQLGIPTISGSLSTTNSSQPVDLTKLFIT